MRTKHVAVTTFLHEGAGRFSRAPHKFPKSFAQGLPKHKATTGPNYTDKEWKAFWLIPKQYVFGLFIIVLIVLQRLFTVYIWMLSI